ncbi:type II toxin-antitoxin system Phd/YefM family antitoxin [Desulfosporosinus hippei]|uniref:Antitoxin n=1 Tax=Desulfosporosinus hippei DSM 8344 TaxID=1121419 RepID=A0A1G8HFQ4_9FIRM|nr:type II toxin-antitoxin system prevent-host-death family antitoxin [Desulfosporosinus hippei]SDI05300.1 prevent-host-death family protein [Desulfosporosinus hippei DSM 8344]
MLITETEFTTNIEKYLSLVNHEEIIITKNGRGIAKLTSLKEDDKVETIKSFLGSLSNDISLEQSKDERLKKYELID